MPQAPPSTATPSEPAPQALSSASSARRSPEAARLSAELDRLMDRYASGDNAAFAELYRQLAPRLRMFLLRLCGAPRLADDLLQDTFLRVHRARGSFTAGAAVVPWSYAIARNVYIDHSRRGRDRGRASLDDLEESAQPLAAPGASPHAELVGKRTLDVVRATLAKLPAMQREAFVLVRFEGMSIAEAAAVLDASESAVKLRAFRAYEAFRAALGATGEGP